MTVYVVRPQGRVLWAIGSIESAPGMHSQAMLFDDGADGRDSNYAEEAEAVRFGWPGTGATFKKCVPMYMVHHGLYCREFCIEPRRSVPEAKEVALEPQDAPDDELEAAAVGPKAAQGSLFDQME